MTALLASLWVNRSSSGPGGRRGAWKGQALVSGPTNGERLTPAKEGGGPWRFKTRLFDPPEKHTGLVKA